MHPHGRRFRLGLFVLGTGGMFVALLAFILQNSLHSERATYFILFEENVKGMVVGSKVNFQGVPIGVVADMRFQDGKTLVELRVDPSRASTPLARSTTSGRLPVNACKGSSLGSMNEPGSRYLPS